MTATSKKPQPTHPPKKESRPMIALVLQGGGALGAYHIGAFEAMQEAGFEPDWIAGISIGAINSAVLAGNPPDKRLARMIDLWENIQWPELIPSAWHEEFSTDFQRMLNAFSSLQAFATGQPYFFRPRWFNFDFFSAAPMNWTSYYDTSPMLDTLERYVDFDLINHQKLRISLGATDVESGELKFFNNWEEKIGPHHVLASGSLPPGFPAVQVGQRWYWDGGCVSNTPLEAVLRNLPDRSILVFMIDLWGANGTLPTNMEEVSWRQKQIQYASRTAYELQSVTHTMNLCHRLANAGQRDYLPAPLSRYLKFGHSLDIVHIIYNPSDDEVSTSDAEFSGHSIALRRKAGLRDMRAAIKASPWAQKKLVEMKADVHSVRQGAVKTNVFPGIKPRKESAVPTKPRVAAKVEEELQTIEVL